MPSELKKMQVWKSKNVELMRMQEWQQTSEPDISIDIDKPLGIGTSTTGIKPDKLQMRVRERQTQMEYLQEAYDKQVKADQEKYGYSFNLPWEEMKKVRIRIPPAAPPPKGGVGKGWTEWSPGSNAMLTLYQWRYIQKEMADAEVEIARQKIGETIMAPMERIAWLGDIAAGAAEGFKKGPAGAMTDYLVDSIMSALAGKSVGLPFSWEDIFNKQTVEGMLKPLERVSRIVAKGERASIEEMAGVENLPAWMEVGGELSKLGLDFATPGKAVSSMRGLATKVLGIDTIRNLQKVQGMIKTYEEGIGRGGEIISTEKKTFMQEQLTILRQMEGVLQDKVSRGLGAKISEAIANAQPHAHKGPKKPLEGKAFIKEQKGIGDTVIGKGEIGYHSTDKILTDKIKSGSYSPQNYFGEGVYISNIKRSYPGKNTYEVSVPAGLKTLDLTQGNNVDKFLVQVSKKTGIAIEKTGQGVYEDLRLMASKVDNGDRIVRNAVDELTKGYEAIKSPVYLGGGEAGQYEMAIRKSELPIQYAHKGPKKPLDKFIADLRAEVKPTVRSIREIDKEYQGIRNQQEVLRQRRIASKNKEERQALYTQENNLKPKLIQLDKEKMYALEGKLPVTVEEMIADAKATTVAPKPFTAEIRPLKPPKRQAPTPAEEIKVSEMKNEIDVWTGKMGKLTPEQELKLTRDVMAGKGTPEEQAILESRVKAMTNQGEGGGRPPIGQMAGKGKGAIALAGSEQTNLDVKIMMGETLTSREKAYLKQQGKRVGEERARFEARDRAWAVEAINSKIDAIKKGKIGSYAKQELIRLEKRRDKIISGGKAKGADWGAGKEPPEPPADSTIPLGETPAERKIVAQASKDLSPTEIDLSAEAQAKHDKIVKLMDRWTTGLRERVQDTKIRIKRLYDDGDKLVREGHDIYQTMYRYPNRVSARLEDFAKEANNVKKDILKTAKGRKIKEIQEQEVDKVVKGKRMKVRQQVEVERDLTPDDLADQVNAYLEAKHAVERNAAHYDGAAGITDAEAAALMNELNKSPHIKEIKRLAALVREIDKGTLELYRHYGLISEEFYQKLNQMYPNHVPLNRLFENDPYGNVEDILKAVARRKPKSEFAVQASGIKKALGSRTEREDIILNVIQNHEAALMKGERNLVGLNILEEARSLEGRKLGFMKELTVDEALKMGYFDYVDMAKIGPKTVVVRDIETGRILKLPKNEVRDYASGKKFYKDATGIERKVELVTESKSGSIAKALKDERIKERVMPTLEKGELKYIYIPDAALASAMKGLEIEQLGWTMRKWAWLTRFYAGLMTRYNPEFLLPNKIRDMQEVMVFLMSEKEMGLGAALGTAAQDILSMKDIGLWQLGKKTPGTKLYQQARMDGIEIGNMASSLVKDAAQIDMAQFARMQKSNPKQAVLWLLKKIDNANMLVENSTRFSVYRTALAKGLTREKAASLAIEASINFRKMGNSGPLINGLWMFSNAAIQGNVKMLKSLNPIKHPDVAGTVIGALLAANWAASNHNDKIDPDWAAKVPEYDMLTGLIIVTGSGENFNYIKIPSSWGLAPINVAARLLIGLLKGHRTDAGDVVGQIGRTMIDAYNPLASTSFTTSVTPTVLRAPWELKSNKSWTGRRIKPTREVWKRGRRVPMAEHLQYYRYLPKSTTGKVMIEATKKLSHIGIEISPADVDYAFRQAIGGSGRFTIKTFDTTMAVVKGESPAIRDVPIASRIFKSIEGEGRGGQELDELDELDKMKEWDRMRNYKFEPATE